MGNRYHLSYHDVGYRHYWHVSNLGDFPTRAEAQAAIRKKVEADRLERSANSSIKNITVPVPMKVYDEIKARAGVNSMTVGAYVRHILLTILGE